MDVFDFVLPVMLLFSAGFTAIFAYGLRAKRRAARRGLVTTGRCVRITFGRGPGTLNQGPAMHTTVYGFTDRNGGWVEFEESGAAVPEGTPVTIRYDPANPRRSATLADGQGPSIAAEVAALTVFGCVTLVLTAVLLVSLS